jgi:uncharacterized membrane protein
MGTNLVLAVLPLVLAVWLFRCRRRSVIWWAGLMAFVGLLPNAPYVVTDLVHLVPDIRAAPSSRAVVLGLLPAYGLFILIGLESYALSVRLFRRSVLSSGWRAQAAVSEAAIHVLCAVGVVLGRFERLNSWDVLHPSRLARAPTVLAAHPVSFLAILIASVVCSLILQSVTSAASQRVHHLAVIGRQARAM